MPNDTIILQVHRLLISSITRKSCTVLLCLYQVYWCMIYRKINQELLLSNNQQYTHIKIIYTNFIPYPIGNRGIQHTKKIIKIKKNYDQHTRKIIKIKKITTTCLFHSFNYLVTGFFLLLCKLTFICLPSYFLTIILNSKTTSQ